MGKEWYRDYATHAFQQFAALGYPTRDAYERKIRQEITQRNISSPSDVIDQKIDDAITQKEPLLKDIDAVNVVIGSLECGNKAYIIDALKDVYFFDPSRKPRKGEIHSRVLRCASDRYVGTRTVYAWLKTARAMFCSERGINTSEE